MYIIGCKKVSSPETVKTTSERKIKNEIRDTWKFEKIFSLSPQSNYPCESRKYEDFKFSLSQDSVFINDKYTDNVYISFILPKSYFDGNYLYEAYTKRLKEELNIDFPLKIKSIRNKKADDKTSLLDKYFQDAFFVGEYMFFEENGCIICLKKETTQPNSTKLSKSISKNDLLDSKIPVVGKRIVIDDNEASTVYKIADNIFIAWFDGDNERWYLVTYQGDKLFSYLLIGKSETVETKDGTTDNYIDFKIDKDLKITLEYSSGKNFNSKEIEKTEKYRINLDNNKIEKL